ncbi:hypothetical protein Lser_V15G38918 [Lactuca serriola]
MERRFWPKFGDVVQEDICARLTMVSTEEIIYEQPRAPGTKVEDSNAAGDPLAQMSKGGDVLMVCRTCGKKGDHWTSNSPYKDLAQRTESFSENPNPSDSSATGATTYELHMWVALLQSLKDGDLNVGGETRIVDLNNLEEYISLVVDATVKTGITRQLEAFRVGFNQVFDVSSLQILSPSELDYLLCGRREMWEADTLVEHIKFDHGYTSKSPVVINLLEIMREFNPEQQRAFCQYVTGAPRLPPGGLAVLNPKLTISRKIQQHCIKCCGWSVGICR